MNEYVDLFYKKFNIGYGSIWNYHPDHIALIDLIKKYEITSIFEIGTWSGWTTLLMWLYPTVNRMKTIDFGTEYGHPWHPKQSKKFYGKYIKNTPVKFEFCDSMKYEPKDEEYDMVFIDGNHDYEHVKSDTELALKLKPKIIVWHDYGMEPAVSTFVNEFGGQSFAGLVAYKEING